MSRSMSTATTSLNPCCNGRWSLRTRANYVQKRKTGLNPCCNGRWSLSRSIFDKYVEDK